MNISWNWLSEIVDLTQVGGAQKLAELLTSRGLEVEGIEFQDHGFEKVITAQILERQKHPQADKLSLCKVSMGKGDPLEIVCGAQNMKAGDKVALAQVGAHLPNGLKIEKSKIRGVESCGMLCSEEELKLKDHSDGILILSPETPLGLKLAEILGRNDTLLTFKLTANRGDCMSHRGMAREVAAALGQKIRKIPLKKEISDQLAQLSNHTSKKNSPIQIHLEAGEQGPQFFGCYIQGVKVGPSPAWMVKRLESLGSRSINNVVDASNLLMLELGHPTHAYDAELIRGGKIIVRNAKNAESLPLLDGQTVTLNGSELIIADAERPVGLAGVMGGGNSEVRDSTRNLFLECAEFDPVRVRRTAFRHQRRTDAAQRFEKGIDPLELPYVIGRLAQLITELAGGTIQCFVSAQTPSRANDRLSVIEVKPEYFEKFLGMSVPPERAKVLLEGLDCKVEKTSKNTWKVQTPSYRRDLTLVEDLAEEIARSIGYDQIQTTIPTLSSAPQSIQASSLAANVQLIDRAKDALVRYGMNETLCYSFTHRQWLARFGMKTSAAIQNPLSEEHEALVPSLIPGLVKNAIDCWNHHFGSESLPLRIFEIRPTFHNQEDGGIRTLNEMATPVQERWCLSLVMSGPRYSGGLRVDQGSVDYYDLKAVVEGVAETLGIRGLRFQPLRDTHLKGSLFHPGKSAEVLVGKEVAGLMGLFHPRLSRDLKIEQSLWICEIDWENFTRLALPVYQSKTFKAWPEFPGIERDFALLVREEVTAEKIIQVATRAGKPLAKVVKVFDVYRGNQVAAGMASVAVRVIFCDDKRSLQESEAENASRMILESWKKELGVELRT